MWPPDSPADDASKLPIVIFQFRILLSVEMRKCEIKLLESPIPTPPATAAPSQKAHFDNISGTKRGTMIRWCQNDRKKILNKKIRNSKKKMPKMVKNGQKWSKMVKMVKMV